MTDWTQKAEEAVLLHESTDRDIAYARYKYEKDKREAKKVWSRLFHGAKGNIEERKAQAETHEDYQLAQAAELTALKAWEEARSERDTAKLIIEFWRSWQKAINEGHV